MGKMTFLLPPKLNVEAARELERAFVAGGPDNTPWPTQVQVEPNQLSLFREVEESGCLVTPWEIDGLGRFMESTATLIERALPYHCQVELARGKLTRLRSQASDWEAGGLVIPPELEEQIRRANLTFARAIGDAPAHEISDHAQNALLLTHRAAEHLVRLYMDAALRLRHEREHRLSTFLGCRLAGPVPERWAAELSGTFNSVSIPFAWSAIESSEGCYEWKQQDALLNWAETRGFEITGGPLVDFSSAHMPDWLWLWERDLPSLAKFMTSYVTAAVERYHHRIHRWHLTSASNSAAVLSLSEDELLWLTVRTVQAARQIDPELELIVGIAQPWGEYMATADRNHSPFVFADTLTRSELQLAALDLELVMGITPRGSYCRDLLDTSRVLDLYALLGVPLRLTLGYPSSRAGDPKADPDMCVQAGYWQGGFTPETQEAWATAFLSLALAKPYIQAIHWAHLTDTAPHQFPHSGLVDIRGNAKRALGGIRDLRKRHID